jgi:hydroxymethylpyrimidine pyrophosphatase-like HAD family hydrolase
MDNIQQQQKFAFTDAINQIYAGAIFDIDGTLTVRGDEFIPAFMVDALAELSLNVPIAVCTGRRLDQALDRIAPIFTRSRNPIYSESQWVFICENGSVGYYFDEINKKYIEFHRVNYPYSEEQRHQMFNTLKGKFSDKTDECFMNEVSMVFRPLFRQDPNREALRKRSYELGVLLQEAVSEFDPKRLLSVSEAGIGVNISPVNGDKDTGVLAFAKFLREQRKFNVDQEAREILVVGDQPGALGNDRMFLNGVYGTPFTVGDTVDGKVWPLPVFGRHSNIRLIGPEGTLALLQQVKFRNGFSLL